jgi:hypothetical protein
MSGGFTVKQNLDDRLNRLVSQLISEEFLNSVGTANEIAFYIFEYPPQEELKMREHIQFLLTRIHKLNPSISIKHINLFEFVLDCLKERNLLDKTIDMQKTKGDEAVLKALKGPLNETRLAKAFADKVYDAPETPSQVFISGVGSVFPLLRTHSLLNNLHPVMGDIPVVIFYPGNYSGQFLRLFDKLDKANYYRAFRLIP